MPAHLSSRAQLLKKPVVKYSGAPEAPAAAPGGFGTKVSPVESKVKSLDGPGAAIPPVQSKPVTSALPKEAAPATPTVIPPPQDTTTYAEQARSNLLAGASKLGRAAGPIQSRLRGGRGGYGTGYGGRAY